MSMKMYSATILKPTLLLGALALGSPCFGQAFNIDFGANLTYPIPSSVYGAAAAQPGNWNAMPAGTSGLALSDLSGVATGVVFTETGAGGNYEFDNLGTAGDDENLLDDVFDLGGLGGLSTISIGGLADGPYQVFTYSWAPDQRDTYCTEVDIFGSTSGAQIVCGLWTGAHVQGVTYALHDVTISGGNTLTITAITSAGFGSINGIQLKPELGGPSAYCAPGNTNSVSAGGGILTSAGGYGTANATFDLTDVPDQPGILYSGDGMPNIPFGCGNRCVGGFTIRGGVINPVGHQAMNVPFDMSASTSVNMQYWYRDPLNLPACGDAFNLTNALMP
ncbi:MAG: hypothetical protein ACI841_001550 [Planctomycetota bacterium]|jgi:hypothetical protein